MCARVFVMDASQMVGDREGSNLAELGVGAGGRKLCRQGARSRRRTQNSRVAAGRERGRRVIAVCGSLTESTL